MTELEKFLETVGEVTGENLNAITEKLLTFKEFEGVKKINVLKNPFIEVLKETEEIIDNVDNYLGDETKVVMVDTRILKNGESPFSEEIDLYHIGFTPRVYAPDVVSEHLNKVGAWKTPELYEPKTFESYQQISIKWSPSKIKEQLRKEDGTYPSDDVIKSLINKRLTDEFMKLLEIDTNIPNTRHIMVRITPRSAKIPSQE